MDHQDHEDPKDNRVQLDLLVPMALLVQLVKVDQWVNGAHLALLVPREQLDTQVLLDQMDPMVDQVQPDKLVDQEVEELLDQEV